MTNDELKQMSRKIGELTVTLARHEFGAGSVYSVSVWRGMEMLHWFAPRPLAEADVIYNNDAIILLPETDNDFWI